MHSGRDLALGDSFYWANYVAAARRGNGVTDLALVRGYHQTSGIRAERAFDGGGLDGVVLGGRGAVRRDVVHLLGGKGGLPPSNRNGLRFGAATFAHHEAVALPVEGTGGQLRIGVAVQGSQ